MKKSTVKIKVPFYAHLLTKQEMRQTAAGSLPTGPRLDMTDPLADLQSQKYPSDQEDVSGAV